MRTASTQKLTLCALCCALLCVCSQIQVPLPPVPLSLSLLAVHLTGALLGSRAGAASVAAYVLLGAAGVPVFAGFAGGLSVLLGPTGGFLAGYMLCAWLVGRLTERFGISRRSLLLSMTAGTLACYVPGTAWFMLVTGTDFAGSLSVCMLPFIPGDLFKILLSALLVRRLQKPLRAMGL